MTDRPIFMSAPMIRALLAGTKVQTRRAVKPQPAPNSPHDGGTVWLPKDGLHIPVGTVGHLTVCEKQGLRCPYGVPGDRLYVREAWGVWHDCLVRDAEEPTWYRADHPDVNAFGPARWRPSIHMPSHRSRILLEVADVRVERLQDISEADALAEGIVHLPRLEGFGLPDGSHYHGTDPRISYWSLWDAINGQGSVEANPFVWAVSFRLTSCRI